MIKEIKISNFLSFKEETLSISHVPTVLVGINGSGKSNVFKALRLLQEGISGIGLKSFVIDMLGGIDNIRYKSAETADKPIKLQFKFNFLGGNIELMLDEKNLNSSIHVSDISDGTLRYLCLLAILCNPCRGSFVCIDEPETGLHPDMIAGIGRLIIEVSKKSNIIISTHSVRLLNSFEVENIRVIEKDKDNASKIFHYTTKDFEGWYQEFSPGTMWCNGDLGGNRW